MVVISDMLVQGVQMLLVLLLAPLLTGFVRKIKARLVRRQGASVFQPYRDLLRLLRKEVVLADNASWLFRVTPYVTFAAIWVAAALVPTFATGLLFNWTADLIAIVALLGSARFFLALAGMDVGTSFGGIGSSREVMIAALAEPAMLLIVFCMALVAGSTQLSTVANFMASSYVGLRVSLGMALIALIMVALAENARIPVDNPATHLELTMVHEAMVLEYSGRHLAMIEFGAFLKLLLYISLIACVFLPWKIALFGTGAIGLRDRRRRLSRQACGGRLSAGAVRDRNRENAGFPHSAISRRGADAGPARHAAAVRVEELLMQMHSLAFDISHTLAGGLVLISFMMLYQDRLYSLLNVFALHAAGAGAFRRLAGLRPARAASLRHRGNRPGVQGDRHPGGAAPHRQAARNSSRHRVGRRHRPDHAGRNGAGRALDGADAAGDRRRPIRWRARISPSRCRSCCSDCWSW